MHQTVYNLLIVRDGVPTIIPHNDKEKAIKDAKALTQVYFPKKGEILPPFIDSLYRFCVNDSNFIELIETVLRGKYYEISLNSISAIINKAKLCAVKQAKNDDPHYWNKAYVVWAGITSPNNVDVMLKPNSLQYGDEEYEEEIYSIPLGDIIKEVEKDIEEGK